MLTLAQLQEQNRKYREEQARKKAAEEAEKAAKEEKPAGPVEEKEEEMPTGKRPKSRRNMVIGDELVVSDGE